MRRMLAALLLLASPAHATDYVADKSSQLTFVAIYQGESFTGRFQTFTPAISFDPAALERSRFDVRITLASANTDNEERDDLLLGSDFFDSKKLSEARYTATKFRALGGNKFVADGNLTLRGISKPIALTFTWTTGAKTTLQGEARLNRLDFNVGTGDWADTGLLPATVTVKTTLNLTARP